MSEPTKTLVNYSAADGVATIELCNPPANAYSYEMFRQVDDAILRARFDDAVHVLLLRGAGEKFFCAGADISMLDGVSPAFKYNFCLHANETLLRLENTNKLVIAAIDGHCVGGGLEVALAADLRIARGGKGKIGLPEAKLGVLPGTGGTQRLSRIVGKSKSIEMMIESVMMTPEQAAEAGLVNKIFTGDDYWQQVMSYAKSFCPPGRASKAVGFIKRAVQSGQDLSLESGLALERELQQQLFQSDDAKEGISAFVNKRDAVFTGR
jgi:enoyl-CoA hydratase/carnithine racemase